MVIARDTKRMCGIAGIVLNQNGALVDLPQRLSAMGEAMLHRGPDDGGVYLTPDGKAGLVNRRLAIRDLSPAGHMPMSNADQSVWITYNGEIYNTEELRPELERQGFVFHSNSDTEVILHGYEAWGEEVVGRLRGMFAFALFSLDKTGQRVQRTLIARDRLGIKPCYYAVTEDSLGFASELRSLRAANLVGTEVNPAALTGYLLSGSVPNPLTIYQDIQALPPATLLIWEGGRAELRSYWKLPTEQLETTAAQAAEEVRGLLQEAVRIRLVSDVPLGAFLSGGLDSSAIATLMRRATNGTIRTCSMVFAEQAYNEAPYARAVAQAVGAEHFERVICSHDVKDEWERIFASMDQPSIDGVNTYFVSQTARQAGLTVALSGLGGDELFGGYPNTFNDVPRVLRALTIAQRIPGGAALARTVLKVIPDKARWTRTRDALARPASAASAYVTRRGLFAPSEVRELLQPDLWQTGSQAFELTAYVSERVNGTRFSPTGFDWISRAELRTYMSNQLLRDTDVMSMAHSLEVRVPFLDHRLVEFILRIPEALRKNGRTIKPLLWQAVEADLPAIVRDRQDKQGFTFPFAVWLRQDLRTQVKTTLDQVEARGWLQPGAIRQVTQDYEAGRIHWSRLWALVALGAIA
jgi:asparagine synthase (glutamine-hydrolysing)